MKIFKIFKHMKNGDLKLSVLKRLEKKEYKKRLYTKKYKFIDRRKNTNELIIILAGFQPYYWDIVMGNINDANINNYDVCICVPKGEKESIGRLYEIAEKYDWSLLIIKKDLLAQAQNVTIKLHPMANVFYKFDEDIIVPRNFFTIMNYSVDNILKNSEYEVDGYIAPVLNINKSTFKIYLEGIGKLEDFTEHFGVVKIGSDITHKSLDFAEYMNNTLLEGINAVSEKLHANNKGKFKPFSVRCSIGVMYFTRKYFDMIGGFKVDTIGAMGVEEMQVCEYGINNWKPSMCACDVMCAHLGYFTQKETCRMFFENHKEALKN